jgi:Ca-activated chloride channel family protein
MRKTIALFALALSLLIAALVIGLRHRHEPPTPAITEAPVKPPTAPTASSRSAVSIGDLVKLEGSLSNAFVRTGDGQKLSLLMDLTAKDVGSDARSRMAVAIVIDRSGSMAGDKIQKARQASKQFVARLTDEDEIAIVTYSSDYSVDLPLTTIKGQRNRIDRVIDEILDGGGTDIGAGLQAGLSALKGAHKDAVKRLLLVSDGNANQGITDSGSLASIAKRGHQDGITVSTLGVGVDFNEDLLGQMAQGAGGGYYYARDPEAIASAFDKELTGLTKLAARNVEVGLELAPNVSISEVYGYRTENRRGRIVIPVGDMAGGERRRVMVQLELSGSEGKIDVSNIVLSYNPASSDTAREHQGQLSVAVTDNESELASGERRDVGEAFEAALAAQAREQAAVSFQSGNKTEALHHLRARIDETKKKNVAMKSVVLEEQVMEMEDAMKSISSAPSVDSDQGKDIVKHEKLRAREVFTY